MARPDAKRKSPNVRQLESMKCVYLSCEEITLLRINAIFSDIFTVSGNLRITTS